MRVAIISDIHASLVALEAVLADISREEPDKVVCLGDVAVSGPQPQEVIARLRALDYPTVMGNGDDWLLDPPPPEPQGEGARRYGEIDAWCLSRLTPADLNYVSTFQPTLELALGGDQRLLCFHGSPRSNTDIILSTTPPDELDRLLSGFSATIMAGGHTHIQMIRRHGAVLLLNPGSVGLPYQRRQSSEGVRIAPWAEYAIVGYRDGHLSVDLRRVLVDTAAVTNAMHTSGMPHAEGLAAMVGDR